MNRRQCCYWNWTLKGIEEGHVNFDRKAEVFSKENRKTQNHFRHEETHGTG